MANLSPEGCEPRGSILGADIEERLLPRTMIELMESRGYRARLISMDRAREVADEIAERRSRGELDEELYRSELADFEPSPRNAGIIPRSILIAAIPRPETSATFYWRGAERRLVIPPTYTAYRTVARDWLAWLRGALSSAGHEAIALDAPLKPLAVRSGLARYGRNNITYVSGLGSYYELVAAATTVPCENEGWVEYESLESCQSCQACEARCPTGAIRRDRFLIDAHRCLVFHNEKDSSVFPEWIKPSAHHTLVGCMRCQWVCPENRGISGWAGDGVVFSESETGQLLEGVAKELLSEETIRKLEKIDALRFLAVFPRNLAAVLSREEAGRKEAVNA